MSEFRKQLLIKIGISGGVFSVLAGLTSYLGFDIQNRSNLIFLKRSEVGSELREVRDLSRLRQAAKVAEPLKAKLDKALPGRDYLFTLPREFDKLASDRHLSFNFKFAEETKPDPNHPSQIRFEMTLQGKYNDILDFLSVIENGSYFINFSNLDMIRSTDKFNVGLTGQIYFNG